MDTKKFYHSKVFWFNAMLCVEAIIMLVVSYLEKNTQLTWAGALTLVAGAINIILRIFFTSLEIER